MHRLATHLRPQRIDQAPGAKDVGEGVVTGNAMKPQADLAGQVEPDGNLLLLPRTGVALGQALQHLAVDQMVEQYVAKS